MDDTKAYIELSDIPIILRRRKTLILFTVIIVLAASILYRTQLMKPLYEARGSMIIGNALDHEDSQFLLGDLTRIQDYMQTYIRLLKTNLVAEKTIEALNLNIPASEFQETIQAFPQPKTQFLDITVKWGNPEQALAILDTTTAVFMEEALRIYPAYSIQVLEKVGPYPVEVLSKKLYYLISLIVSFLIALLVVLTVQYHDNTITSEEDIEKIMQVPVIGSIPKYKRAKFDILSSIQSNQYISLDVLYTLRTNLLYLTRNLNIQSIVITSPGAREGKTTAATMLAIVLAQGGKKTLLMDCNLRSPGIQEPFGIKGTGLSSLILEDIDWRDVVYISKFNNLFVLPAGFHTLNPVEIIASDAMKRLISDMKQIFDYIILDTPPVGLFTDAHILSQLTDGTMMVVSADETDQTEIRKAAKLLQFTEGKLIGVLLNKAAL